MTRRRRQDVVVFDLDDVHDRGAPDEPGPPAGGWPAPARGPASAGPARTGGTADEPGEAGSPDEAALRGGRAPRRREAAVAGAVVLVALAVWGVTGAVHEHERVTRLLGAPGGVLSLAQPPAPLWSAGTDAVDATAFMPGLVVVRRGTALHALDAATGADRWQVEVGGDPVCGPSTWAAERVAVVDPLVCWNGADVQRPTVTVIHANGSSSTRALDGPVAAAAGTSDGGLVTARRVGPTPPDPPVAVTLMDGGGYTLSGSVDQGQDAVVRAEDAATGAVRWERTVTFRPVADVTTCASVTDGPDGPTVDVTTASISTYPGFVELRACGLAAGFTLDGTATTSQSASAWSWAEPYVDGGVLEQVADPWAAAPGIVSALHARDGSLVGIYGQQVLQPFATDGTTSDLLLAGSAGVNLQAIARDGSVRWSSTHTYSAVLVRTPGVIVAQRNDLVISGLSPTTGAELWTVDGVLPPDDGRGNGGWVTAAFTDGSVAALVVVHGGQETAKDVVALDLSTGAVRWRSTLDGDWPQVVAVHGRLLEVVGNQGSRVEDDGHGGTVRVDPGTVTALG